MFQLIEKLRLKPEGTKKRVAFLIALAISGLIFVVWLSVIYPSWRNGQKKEQEVLQQEPGPFSNFATNFSNGLFGIREQFSKIKDSFVSLATSSEASLSATTSVDSTE